MNTQQQGDRTRKKRSSKVCTKGANHRVRTTEYCVNDEAFRLESSRIEGQKKLYADKDDWLRNRLGQFETPFSLARDIVTISLGYLPRQVIETKTVRFLDPAVGTGAFFSALLLAGIKPASALGVEVDKDIAALAQHLWGDVMQVINEDFMSLRDPEPANLILCNPPYTRHHHIPKEHKTHLSNIATRCGMNLSKLTGLHCYFLATLRMWLSEDGISAWLLPSEFVSVNYGAPVRKWLTSKVTLVRMHYFSAEDAQFDEAMVTSAVLWVRNAGTPTDHKVLLTGGPSLTAPATLREVAAYELYKTPKWNQFFFASAPFAIEEDLGSIRRFFSVHRGIATGKNIFFVRSLGEWKSLDVPRQFLIPLLPQPRFMRDVDEIYADDQGAPILENPLFILNCSLPRSRLGEHPGLLRVVCDGEDKDVHKGYLCKRRSPWYKVEKRDPPCVVLTYMGRITKDKPLPFKFIRNHSKAIALNSYLLLYPSTRNFDMDKLWAGLKRITANSMKLAGRVYSGGMYKLEPKEVLKLRIPSHDM